MRGAGRGRQRDTVTCISETRRWCQREEKPRRGRNDALERQSRARVFFEGQRWHRALSGERAATARREGRREVYAGNRAGKAVSDGMQRAGFFFSLSRRHLSRGAADRGCRSVMAPVANLNWTQSERFSLLSSPRNSWPLERPSLCPTPGS